MKKIFTILLLSALFSGQVFSQMTAPKAGVIADLSFIEGNWTAVSEGRTIEARWLPAQKDNLSGFFRIVTPGKANIYELLVYEQAETGTVSLVRHFGPGLSVQEPVDKPVRHVCLESKPGRVSYEKDGEQVRILYEKKGKDGMLISVGKPDGDGWIFKPLFDFKRIK